MLVMCIKFKCECNCHSGPKTTKYNVGHQPWDNGHTTLPERCLIVGPQHWEQHCHNVETTLPERCLNIGPQRWEWHCPSIHTTLPESCLNIGRRRSTLWQHCGNVGILVEIQLCYNVHTTLSGRPHNVAGMFKSIYKWMLLQRWGQHWDNVSTNGAGGCRRMWAVVDGPFGVYRRFYDVSPNRHPMPIEPSRWDRGIRNTFT